MILVSVPYQGIRDLVEPLLGEGVCPAAHRVTDILPELLHGGHRVLSLSNNVRGYASLSIPKFLNTKPEACHVVLQNGVACRGEERGKGKHHRRLWEGPRNPYFGVGRVSGGVSCEFERSVVVVHVSLAGEGESR